MGNYQPLKAAERRAADRRCALDDYLCLVDLGDNRSAMLLDVSETGIGVQSVEGVGEGFSTTFRFQLPDTAVLVEGEGEIAWADRAGRMGVRFTRLADELKPELRTWVSSEANPLFAHQPITEEMADLDARDRVAQLEARIIVSGWAQLQALNFLVDQIAAMTQASGVAIAVEDGSGIVCKASAGIAPQVGVRVNPRSGLSWECVRTKEVVNCVDTENDPRVDRLVCRQLNMRSTMLVPVMKEGRVAGLVEVFSSRPHVFSNQTVILLRRVAEAVAGLDETASGVEAEPLAPMSEALTPPPAVERPPVEVAASRPIEPPKAPAPIPSEPAVTRTPQPSVPVSQPIAATPRVAAPQPAASVSQPVAPQPKPPAPVPRVAPAPPAPIAARIAEPPTPPRVETKPAPAVASTPAPVATPAPPTRPAVAAATSDVATKIGMPFAQEVAAAVKPPEVTVAPAQTVASPKTVETAATKPAEVIPPRPPQVPPATVSTAVRAVEPAASAPPIEIAKPHPAPAPVKEPERVTKPVVERIEISLPPSAPRAKPVEKSAPVITKPAAAEKPREVAPAAMSMAYQDGPLPEVAFSGAAAAAKRAAIAAANQSSPARKEQAAEVPFPYQAVPEPNRRNLYIGIAAAVFLGLSTVAGWYVAREISKPAASAAPPAAAPATTVPVATPAVLPAAATTTTITPAAATKQPATTNTNTTTSAASKTPAPTAKPSNNGEAPTGNNNKPITAATFITSGAAPADAAPAPPIAIAPPNTAGMSSLLSAPVAPPRLSRQLVSQGVTGGKQLLRVQPQYPSAARAMHLSGLVTIKLHVAKNGAVSGAEIVSGHPLLNAAALDAVRRWKYQPFMLNGEPIENEINVQVRFDMPR